MISIRTYCLFLLMVLSIEIGFTQKKWSLGKSRRIESSYIDSAKFYIQTNPASAFDYALLAMNKAIAEKNREDEAECYIVIGNINYHVEQFDLALDNYKKALNIYQELKNIYKINETKELIGKAYESVNELEKSEVLLNEVTKDAEFAMQNTVMRSSKRSLAKVYRKKGEPNKAIKELEDVKQLDIEEGNIQEQIVTNQQLIDVYTNQNPQKALKLTSENEGFANIAQDTILLLDALQKKADIYGKIGQPEEKISTLQQSINLRQLSKDIGGQSEDNYAISQVLMEQNKVSDAIAYLEESIELSEIAGKTEIKKEALKSLSRVYDQSGNYNRALAVYRDYVDATEKSAREREKKILENLELMHSLTKRLQRVDMLENQRLLADRTIELMELEQKVDKKSLKQLRVVVFSLILGILMLSATIYLVYRSSRQKRIANQLLALRSLRSQMNPHFIFNALNSVNNYISKNDDRSANKYLTNFSKLMRAVMENSKHDFVTLTSEVQILELYLKLEHHRFMDKFDYIFNVDKGMDQENIQIPPMLIQPYIENAIWHGLRYKEEKGYLKVEIKNGEHLKVIVEDNGIGRKKSLELKTKNQQEVKSTGLKNINNRLQIINQVHNTNLQVNIEDLDKEKQSGTKVTIDIIQQK